MSHVRVATHSAEVSSGHERAIFKHPVQRSPQPGVRQPHMGGEQIAAAQTPGKLSQLKEHISDFSEPDEPAHDLSKPTHKVEASSHGTYPADHKHLGTLSHELHDYADYSLTHVMAGNPGGDRAIIVQSDDENND